MNTFVYSEMNKTSRNKDYEKIKYFGAFASALGFIIHCGNMKKVEIRNKLTLYRGLQLTPKELEEKYKIGQIINVQGFTSTTLDY